MDELSINVLVDAKQEYTKQLTNLLAPLIFEGIQYIYEEVKKVSNSMQLGILQLFQQQLRTIPKWNQTTVDEEYNRIIEKTKCTWFEELLTAVFVSHTKILTAVRTTDKLKNVNLVIPTGSNFIHKCYIETAREFYKNPYLLDESATYSEKARNIRESLELIKNCISETVRKLLPVQKIIETYLTLNNEEDDEITTIKTFRQDKIKDDITNDSTINTISTDTQTFDVKTNEIQQTGSEHTEPHEEIIHNEQMNENENENENEKIIVEEFELPKKIVSEENNSLNVIIPQATKNEVPTLTTMLKPENEHKIEKEVLDLISDNTKNNNIVSSFVQNQMDSIKPKMKKIVRNKHRTAGHIGGTRHNFDEFSIIMDKKILLDGKKYEYNKDIESTYDELSAKKKKFNFDEDGTSDEESDEN
jgi:hypothetical protein